MSQGLNAYTEVIFRIDLKGLGLKKITSAMTSRLLFETTHLNKQTVTSAYLM